jgi:hypothetical protein
LAFKTLRSGLYSLICRHKQYIQTKILHPDYYKMLESNCMNDPVMDYPRNEQMTADQVVEIIDLECGFEGPIDNIDIIYKRRYDKEAYDGSVDVDLGIKI